MNSTNFAESLSANEPPTELSIYLRSLWFDAKGDWDSAHYLIQDVEDPTAAWVHAYLHRKEGDISNATYWYHRAGKKVSSLSLEEEWKSITEALL
jgi:hypothetical protein